MIPVSARGIGLNWVFAVAGVLFLRVYVKTYVVTELKYFKIRQ
jgi:hypothetical protein